MLILPFLYWLSSPEDARPKRPWQVLYGPLPKHGSGSPTLEGRVFLILWLVIAFGSIARGLY